MKTPVLLHVAALFVLLGPSAYAQEIVLIEAYARMRAAPTVQSVTVHQFEQLTEVSALEFDGVYWEVEHEGERGYVLASSVIARSDTVALTRYEQAFEPVPPDAASPTPTEAAIDRSEEAASERSSEVVSTSRTPSVDDQPTQAEQPAVQPSEDEQSGGDPPAVPPSLRPEDPLPSVGSGPGWVIRAGVQQLVPITPPQLTDLWSSTTGSVIGIGWAPGDRFEVLVEVGFATLPIESDSLVSAGLPVDADDPLEGGGIDLGLFQGGFRYGFTASSSTFLPYLVFQGGLLRFTPQDLRRTGESEAIENPPGENVLFTNNEIVPLVSLGFGLDVRVAGPVVLFAEARAAFGLTEREGTALLPLRLGLSLR